MGNSFTRIFGKREVRILFQGLDAAGKTTILYRLKLGEVVTTIPTIGFNVETIEHKNVMLTAWDMGGRDKMRPLFRHYYTNTDGIVFVIDSNDRERMDYVKDEIFRMLGEDDLQRTCVAILANKQDLKNAMSVDELVERLDLNQIKQPWCIFPAVAVTGDGLYECLDWLVDQMTGAQAASTASKATEGETNSPSAVTKHVNVFQTIGESFKTVLKWFSSSKG